MPPRRRPRPRDLYIIPQLPAHFRIVPNRGREILEDVNTALHQVGPGVKETFEFLEHWFGIGRLNFVLATMVIFIFFLMFSPYAPLATNAICLVYPIERSLFKEAELDQIERRNWLAVWVIYGILSIFESLFYDMFIIQGYWLAKFLFLNWCALYPFHGPIFLRNYI